MSKLPPLPDSRDERFWGKDKDHIRIDPKQVEIFGANEGHRWVQQGPYIICKSCVLPHSIHIGMDKKLVGYNEDGSPRIVPKDEHPAS